MPDDQPTLHVDTDWKKQAQEEKRRLAEQEQERQAERAVNPPTRTVPLDPAYAAGHAAEPPASTAQSRPGQSAAAARDPREMPAATFASLTQSLLTQILIYLGDVSLRGSEPVINLDMAKHLIDTLSVLEEKSKNNLTPDEQKLLDRALYESRMRYVAVAAQFVNP
jgi:hypothetical protein